MWFNPGPTVIRLLARFFAALPTPALIRAGKLLGAFWFHVVRVRRRVAEQAVARAFPEKSRAEVRAVVKANFQHLMVSLFESLAYVALPDEALRDRIRFEGIEESVLQPRARGLGVVAISAHIGNFEMCTDACGLLYELPMLLVARLPKGGFARAMLDAFRGRNHRMEVFEPKGSGPKVVERLQTKRSVLAFVVDQNLRRGRGIFLPFLGDIANTTTGFASLQRKAGAALCVVQMYREPGGTHRLRITPVPPSDHPHLRVAMINDTFTMSKHIESFVRERPEQWFWVHRRWKARPEPGDLVRTERGLEHFARGRVAAFIATERAVADARFPEAARLLRDAGVALFLVGRDAPPAVAGAAEAVLLPEALGRTQTEHEVDVEGSVFAGAAAGDAAAAARAAGLRIDDAPRDLVAVTGELLDRTVGSAEEAAAAPAAVAAAG